MGDGPHPQPARFPDKAVLRVYIDDIKQRIGTVCDQQTRLAGMLGQLGGEATKNMSCRLCAEGHEALQAYRKFLKGEPLIEGVVVEKPRSLHEWDARALTATLARAARSVI